LFFDINAERLAADTAYGSGANLNWLVDKSKHDDGTFSREDFTFDKERNVYVCPAGKVLTTTGKLVRVAHRGKTLVSGARLVRPSNPRSHMLAYKDLTRRRDTETRLCVKRTFRALNAYYASDPRARLTGG
jgi:hypothetical protein